jgi:alkyldihydroxyacetonephosphate synthase
VSELAQRLTKELGPIVDTDAETLAAHRHDAWMLAELLDLEGRGAPAPAAVLRPRSTDEVARALVLCRQLGVPVIPFGGGSGVCGAVESAPASVVLSTRALSGLIELDDHNLVARFAAGTMGMEAELRVQQDGLTIGHWPQSIELSTVGGWVATRAAGQFSTAYGNIEDVLFALEVVLPDGRVLRTRDTPRASSGPDLRQLFLGSEGTLGVITEVAFCLRTQPEASRGSALHFPDLGAGLEAIRQIMRADWRPPVVRLYDADESQRQFSEFCPAERALLLMLHEGPELRVRAELEAVSVIAAAAGGQETDAACVTQWLERRNHVPTFRELLERGLVVDTIEVATVWDRVLPLYDEVTRAVGQVPGVRAVTAHSSHSYGSGTNLYFTFVAKPERREDMADTYRACWRRTMDAVVSLGAGIAHHHGIGRVRRAHLPQELGPVGVDLLRAIKATLDPDSLLNPGALFPDP